VENVSNPKPSSIPDPLTVSRFALGRPPSRNLPGPRPRTEVDPEVWQRVDMRRALARRDLKNVYRILQRHGMSQRWIAARTEQSQSEISEILAGRQVLNYDLLVRIALGLGLARGWLGLDYDPDTADRFAPNQGGGR
jgi:hypothetical protein